MDCLRSDVQKNPGSWVNLVCVTCKLLFSRPEDSLCNLKVGRVNLFMVNRSIFPQIWTLKTSGNWFLPHQNVAIFVTHQQFMPGARLIYVHTHPFPFNKWAMLLLAWWPSISLLGFWEPISPITRHPFHTWQLVTINFKASKFRGLSVFFFSAILNGVN